MYKSDRESHLPEGSSFVPGPAKVWFTSVPVNKSMLNPSPIDVRTHTYSMPELLVTFDTFKTVVSTQTQSFLCLLYS